MLKLPFGGVLYFDFVIIYLLVYLILNAILLIFVFVNIADVIFDPDALRCTKHCLISMFLQLLNRDDQ